MPLDPVVTLQPRHPPARKRRKARGWAAEIRRLLADGYTCDEIREALADVGVVVSRSTVQREAQRASRRDTRHESHVDAARASAVEPARTSKRPAAPAVATTPLPADPRSPREIAEAFMSNQINNPLLRTTRSAG